MTDRPFEVYEFGEFRLDVGEHSLSCQEGRVRVALPDKPFLLLVLLVRCSGRLVTKDEILSEVWPGVFVEDGNVGKAIHAIRNALGDRGTDRRFIETVAKHGYRFVADVRVVGAGMATPRPAASRGPTGGPGRSPAYDLYMRGKVKADSERLEDADEAIALLEAAVRIDPSNARAHAQLARAYNTRAFKFTSQPEGRRLREDADVALAKALDLEPHLAEAHFARGLILWTKAKGFPHEQAIRAFQRALALAPDADETHHQLSMVYSHVGLLEEAQAHVRRAIDLNPNNTMARFRVAVYTAWQCRFGEALAVLKTVPSDVSPFLVDRGRAEVHLQLGHTDRAWAISNAFLAAHPDDEGGSLTSVRAVLLARAGDTRQATKTIARALELGTGFGHFHHTAYNIAAAYAALGDPQNAVAWLEAAADDGFPCYPYFEQDPCLDSLRGYRRFIDFMGVLHDRWRGFKAMTTPLLPNRET